MMKKNEGKSCENLVIKSCSPKSFQIKSEVSKNFYPGYITTDRVTYRSLKDFTKQNRKKQTVAETLMWNALRNRKLIFKFRRQHAIGKYIVDFVCLEKKIIIEIDGDYHIENKQAVFDKTRSNDLEFSGYRVLRFSNDNVLNNLSAVIQKIKDHL